MDHQGGSLKHVKRRSLKSYTQKGATFFVLLTVVLTVLLMSMSLQAETQTKVFLNGEPAPVFFNDGDSFRVLGGRFAGSKARLAGFNTLESHGPVHSWGTWTTKEMYNFAKIATWHAQKGIWHCESEDLSTDTYGRILWYCKDLAIDQVRRGYAHAMVIGDLPFEKEILEAQHDAIDNRRGIWARGVPNVILTSTHSTSEGGGKDGKTYNRLVSSRTARSYKWQHNDRYGECQNVCAQYYETTDSVLEKVATQLKAVPELKSIVSGVEDLELIQNMVSHVMYDSMTISKDKDENAMVATVLDSLLTPDVMKHIRPIAGKSESCMVYVDFQRRYGPDKAKCLR